MLQWTSVRRMINNTHYSFSNVSFSVSKKLQSAPVNVNKQDINSDDSTAISKKKSKFKSNSDSKDPQQLVAAAFASLRDLSFKSKPASSSTLQIAKASDINSLLSVAEAPFITRYQALQIVSKLSDWASAGRIKLSDFESDIRFAKLCRLLGKRSGTLEKTDLADLSVVLDVTADEQAAKLITSISLQQAIKVLKSLSYQKRRSTPLLRSLAFNIGKSSETIDLKEAADIFYACTILNYPDEVLLEKVTSDVCINLPNNRNAAVVGSILKSLGILKYKNKELLDSLCQWITKNQDVCRTKNYFSLLLTAASVNYMPNDFEKIFKVMKPLLKEEETNDVNEWIDIVWSLVVLKLHNYDYLNSVLNNNFLNKIKLIKVSSNNYALHFKLLNINGVAKQLGENYTGSLLNKDSHLFKLPVTKTKEKKHFLDSVLNTLSNFVEITNNFELNVNTDMGCTIDAVCKLDLKGNFHRLAEPTTDKVFNVALMLCDYHDMCRGQHNELNGLTTLTHRLIRSCGYRLLVIPYTEFRLSDNLMNRTRYLQDKIKNISNEIETKS